MPDAKKLRPDRNCYYMGIAIAIRERANCLGNKVGAILVVEDRVIAAGYNGTPEDMTNCDEGGCGRCNNRENYGPGQGYDVCICVHAEQNALLSAARFGIAVKDATLYPTIRPCFGFTKELLQAKIKAVYYLHDWQHPDANLNAQYQLLQGRIPGGIRKLEMDDTNADWAVSKKASTPGDTRHALTAQLVRSA